MWMAAGPLPEKSNGGCERSVEGWRHTGNARQLRPPIDATAELLDAVVKGDVGAGRTAGKVATCSGANAHAIPLARLRSIGMSL